MKTFDSKLVKYYEAYFKNELSIKIMKSMIIHFNSNNDPFMYRASLVHELGHVDAAIESKLKVTVMKVKYYVILLGEDDFTVQNMKGTISSRGSVVYCYCEKDQDITKRLVKSFYGGIEASNQLKYLWQPNPIHAYNLLIYRLLNKRWNPRRGSDGYHIKKLNKMGKRYAIAVNSEMKTEAIDTYMKFALMNISV